MINSAKERIPAILYFEQVMGQNWILISLLFLVGILSRQPFQTEILYHWDSVNFAYAIAEFDMAKEQPHPPGYIGYVWLSRVVDNLIQNAPAALVSISIVASTLAFIALFYLGCALFNRQIGLISALFLASSPLFWFYGEIALPHTLDTLLVIVSAWWLYEAMRGKHHYLYPAVVILAIAGGIRPQTLVFLAPLLLFAMRRVGWGRFFIAGLLGAATCLIWFVPLMMLSGGISNYLRLMGEFGARFQDTTSVFLGAGWWGLRRNLIKLVLYTAYGWSVPFVLVIIYAAGHTWRRAWPQNWEKLIFLTLWMAPSLIFYALIHMGQQGLVFVFLPALLLLSAVALERLFSAQPLRLVVATAILVTMNTGIFILVPEFPLGSGTQRLLTRETLINSDRYYGDRFTVIEENFSPASTAIVAASWHHVEYYLPQYKVLPFSVGSKWEVNEGSANNDPGTAFTATAAKLGLEVGPATPATVIIFDPDLMSFNDTPQLAKQFLLSNGDVLPYLELQADDRLDFKTNSFGVLVE